LIVTRPPSAMALKIAPARNVAEGPSWLHNRPAMTLASNTTTPVTRLKRPKVVPRKELDGHTVLEASTKALTEMMDALVRQHRDVVARNPREAERLLGVFMKVQGQLQRSLKERDESRARREEFRKTVPQIVDRCISETCRSIASLMRENGKKLREGIVEVASQRLSLGEFWNRLTQYENAWPIEVATRMKAARVEALRAALRAEEAKVQA